MTIIQYVPSRPRFPDANEYHPVTNWPTLVKSLGETKILGFKVGNGDLNNPASDPTFPAHLKGAEDNGLIALGYWWGPTKVDSYLKMFPPKDGRIPCLDFEGVNLNADLANTFVETLFKEWGRWPWFYGHETWIEHGRPGTAVEKCFYWGSDYRGYLEMPSGVGTAIVHQYSASGKGPLPHSFPGVSPNSDMNSLLLPFDKVRESAGLGGDYVALDPVKDKAVFKQMADEVFGTPSELFWERMLMGVGDFIRNQAKRDIPDPYGLGYDWAQKVSSGAGGGIPVGTKFTATTE
jgi:hypothetical protein